MELKTHRIPPEKPAYEDVLGRRVEAQYYKQKQEERHNLLIAALWPPEKKDDCRTIAFLKELMPGIYPYFTNVFPFTPVGTAARNLNQTHLKNTHLEDPARCKTWMEELVEAVLFVKTGVPVLYIAGGQCNKNWTEYKEQYFVWVRTISKKCRVHVYKVNGTEEKVIVLERYPPPSSPLKQRGGSSTAKPGMEDLAAVVQALVRKDPPSGLWVDADHSHLQSRLDRDMMMWHPKSNAEKEWCDVGGIRTHALSDMRINLHSRCP